MALATLPASFASGAPVNATGVVPSTAAPDNAVQIVMRNTSTTETALWGIGTAGTVLVANTNATEIPPGASFTWSCGPQSSRGLLTGARSLLFGTTAGALTVAIIYINRFGVA